MSQYEEQAYYGEIPVAEAADEVRASFLRRTYGHLAGAIGAIAALDFAFLQSEAMQERLLGLMLGSPFSWIIVLVVFAIVSRIAQNWAQSDVSKGQQYAGLALYSLAWSVMLAPMLIIAQHFGQQTGTNVIGSSAIITACVFGGLSAFVFVTGKDFSFMGGILSVLTMGALGLMICSWIFGFTLGIVFVVGMIVLMCGYIVYFTSQIMHQVPADKHVAASMLLLGAVMQLFWYVLQLVMYLSNRVQ